MTSQSHITRSLFLLLYLFSKTIAGAPKKVEAISRGTIFVRGQPHLSFFGAKLLSSLNYLCVLSSPLFVSILLLKAFLKSSFFILSFYDHEVIRSDTQDVFFVQYLVGFGYKSRIISRFSLSHLLGQARFYKVFRDLASVTIKSHITRSLNSFLYSFQRVFLVPRKRLRNQVGGHSTFYLANSL